MGLVYLPEVALESLPSSKLSLTTKQSVMLSGTNTVKNSSKQESKTESLMMPQSGMMSKPSMEKSGLEKWISSLVVSPVSHSLSLVKAKQNKMKEICGRIPSESLAKYNHNTHSWRMSQISLLTNTLDEYSLTWPKSGMIVNGILYQQPLLEQGTYGKGSGYWPTPMAQEGSGGQVMKLTDAVELSMGINPKHYKPTIRERTKYFPTPTTRDWKDNAKSPAELKRNSTTLAMRAGGQLNPNWVEWLMGWPLGWSALQPLEMDGFHRWLEEF